MALDRSMKVIKIGRTNHCWVLRGARHQATASGFAVFEWSLRNNLMRNNWAKYVFPVLSAAEGMMLLTHAPRNSPETADT